MSKLPKHYYIIGDNAFTLTNKMLIPYSGPQKREKAKDTYNYYLSQLRIRIEMAFGRMSTKWRIFRRKLDVDLEKCSMIINAAMMLHNFVIEDETGPGWGNGNPKNHVDTQQQFGVDPLPAIDGIIEEDNNGFVPIPLEHTIEVEYDVTQSGGRREFILSRIQEEQLGRPNHNIARNNT